MPICIPEHPSFRSAAERKVWEHLRTQLPKHAHLLANVAITDKNGDHEADFIVTWPGVGILSIEVKGGHIALTDDGVWTTSGRSGGDEIQPDYQAKKTMYAVRDYVESHWSQGRPKMMWMVVFPDTALPPKAETAGLPRKRIVDSSELASIAERIRDEAGDSLRGDASSERCSLFVRALLGRRDSHRDWVQLRRDREHEIQRWTENQTQLLDYLSLNPRFAVVGPAGSGKTFLAVEQTRRLVRAGRRVAVICYSRGLAEFLKRLFDNLPETDRPAYVGNFHAFARTWNVYSPKDATSDWWETTCPERMIEKAASLEPEQRYDAFVVDEAQDIADMWWQAIEAGLLDKSRGLYAFGDLEQQVFKRSGFKELALPIGKLRKNIRNATPIAELASLCADEEIENSDIGGPPVEYIECARESALETADDQIDRLLDEGWEPQDIVLLTTGSRHPEQEMRSRTGKSAYWNSFWDVDDIFYGTVTGFKGLERPVVVLAMNGWKESGLEQDNLYVALSRARDLLIVCGSADDVELAGGVAVLHALCG